MAYRQIEKKKPIRRVLQDTTTKNRTLIQNGATAYLAIPCWYYEVRHPQHTHVHDREWHDHIGWPRPDRIDMSSQDAYAIGKHLYAPYDWPRHGWRIPHRYLDMSNAYPIHLRKEGYSNVEVTFVDPPSGLKAEGYIDQEDDWVVRFMVNPMCKDAIKEDVDVNYTVFVNGTVDGHSRRDVVAKGVLTIVAGPIS